MRVNSGHNIDVDLSEFFDHVLLARDSIGKTNKQYWRDVHVHLQIGVRGLSGDFGYYCLAIHDWVQCLNEPGTDGAICGSTGINHEPATHASSDMYESVFIAIRQFINLPQGMGFELSSELKRRQPLYNCLRLRADFLNQFRCRTFEHLRAHPGSAFRASVPDDRELAIASIFIAKRTGMDDSEGISQMVKSVSEILNDISDEQRTLLLGNFAGSRLNQDVAGGTRVRDNSGSGLSVFPQPQVACDIQLIQVHECALELQDAARFWGDRDDGYPVLIDSED
jgi:hypothetical protein